MTSFEKLGVYQKAYKLSLIIHKKSLTFQKMEQYALADQIRRASKSICANLAEGSAKGPTSKPEFRRYILTALGSAEEVRVWLRYCFDLGYIKESEWEAWSGQYKEISKMLQGLQKSMT